MQFEELLNRERNEGRLEGRLEGRSEGEVKKVIEQTKKKLDKGIDVATIAEHLEEPAAFVEKIAALIRENPSVDSEEILKII